jgi:glycosyltransferase involved in cell wall biosynthesis
MAEGSSGRPRGLVVLGNFALNGQERGNIEVFRAFKEVGGESLFVTHADWGHRHIQPYLDRLGLPWTTLRYARHFTKRLTLRNWIINIRLLLVASWAFGRLVRRYGPTHIHVANPHYFLSVLPALMMTRTPVIYRMGDEPPRHHLLYRWLWRWGIVPRVQTFVCVSEYVRTSAIEAGTPADKTRVIYSHPPERPQPESGVEIEPFEGRTVVFMGQVAAHKGVDVLVEVAAALCRARDDVRFLIAGRITRKNLFGIGLHGKVQSLGLADRIRFLGYVEDVPGLLAAADVHVCPSVWEEPLSNTVVEAKQAGTPSVVFPSGGLPEIVDHKRDGFVCRARTADALNEGLAFFLDAETEVLRETGAAARASIERLGITREAFAQAWLEVYGGTSDGAGIQQAATVKLASA